MVAKIRIAIYHHKNFICTCGVYNVFSGTSPQACLYNGAYISL